MCFFFLGGGVLLRISHSIINHVFLFIYGQDVLAIHTSNDQ